MQTASAKLTPKDILLYLLGQREAILKVANAHHGLWLGMIFVLSAGFAREYDAEDLLRDPWYLLLPLAASLVTSYLLFSLIWLAADPRILDISRVNVFFKRLLDCSRLNLFFNRYAAFLKLYWLTAPLAWLYAIPVEQMFSAADATRANLWLLAIVSLWRVLLITRAISVVYRVRFVQAIFLVMFFADTVAITLLLYLPLPVPIIAIMGGIEVPLSESEDVLHSTVILVRNWALISWPVWTIGTLAIIAFLRLRSQTRARISDELRCHVGWGNWVLAGASLMIWLPILPWSQPPQQLRAEVEERLLEGDVAAGLELMSQHEPADFPPLWNPPPRVTYNEYEPNVAKLVLLAYDTPTTSKWVRELFLSKLELQLRRHPAYLQRLSPEEFDQYLDFVEQQPLESEFFEAQTLPLMFELDDKDRLRESRIWDYPIRSIICNRSDAQKQRIRDLLGIDESAEANDESSDDDKDQNGLETPPFLQPQTGEDD